MTNRLQRPLKMKLTPMGQPRRPAARPPAPSILRVAYRFLPRLISDVNMSNKKRDNTPLYGFILLTDETRPPTIHRYKDVNFPARSCWTVLKSTQAYGFRVDSAET
ncbi:hypothetical protein EVAR_87467_1 [Eumeta japonica]|uniref:Uncharacterized protein n=1 Tax=Eumeta variegata TaxID=151549 RepID=A0A4C1VY62_EUMVA|nr:hypothetical protein EVAR_87467_1 [Eumeta japonica]